MWSTVPVPPRKLLRNAIRRSAVNDRPSSREVLLRVESAVGAPKAPVGLQAGPASPGTSDLASPPSAGPASVAPDPPPPFEPPVPPSVCLAATEPHPSEAATQRTSSRRDISVVMDIDDKRCL